MHAVVESKLIINKDSYVCISIPTYVQFYELPITHSVTHSGFQQYPYLRKVLKYVLIYGESQRRGPRAASAAAASRLAARARAPPGSARGTTATAPRAPPPALSSPPPPPLLRRRGPRAASPQLSPPKRLAARAPRSSWIRARPRRWFVATTAALCPAFAPPLLFRLFVGPRKALDLLLRCFGGVVRAQLPRPRRRLQACREGPSLLLDPRAAPLLPCRLILHQRRHHRRLLPVLRRRPCARPLSLVASRCAASATS